MIGARPGNHIRPMGDLRAPMPPRKALRYGALIIAHLLLFTLVAVTWTPTASAESLTSGYTGDASISTLPDSFELQASISVGDYTQCDPTSAYCGWYGEASQYPAGTDCPGVFDATQGVWVGQIQDATGATDYETTTFTPVQTNGAIELCLYVNDGQSGGTDNLAGEAYYVFNKVASSVVASVDFVRGCLVRFYPFVTDANNDNIDDGTMRLKLTGLSGLWTGTTTFTHSVADINTEPIGLDIETVTGHYKATFAYLGDRFLRQSPPATVYFTVRHCSKIPPGPVP